LQYVLAIVTNCSETRLEDPNEALRITHNCNTHKRQMVKTGQII